MSTVGASSSLAIVPTGKSAEWINLEMAANRSGQSIGALRRKCGETWMATGLAKTMAPPGGGKPCWYVNVSADPAFSAVKFPEQLPFDTRALTKDQRRELFQRRDVLRLWAVARAGGATLGFTDAQITEQFCNRMNAERDLDISARSLRRWHSAYRAEGLAGLVDRRWLDRGSSGGAGNADQFRECLKSYYLSPRGLSITTCHELAMLKAQENGWQTFGLRAAGLYLNKIPKAVRVKSRQGEDAYVAECEPSITRDYTTLHSNEQWVGDHHQYDVIVQHAGTLLRPWLTAWMDMRSRLIAGWCVYAHDPNSNSILSALRGGVTVFGVPELLYIDNGKDFSSYALHGSTGWQRRHGKVQLDSTRLAGILNHLDIRSRFCWRYHGQSKPIERFFNTVEARFSRVFPTYCGRHPLAKPDCLEANLAKGQAPRLNDFIALFGRWLETYHATAHRGQGMEGRSPQEVFNSSWNGFAKRTTSEDMLELLLTRQTRESVVHRNGVEFSGLHYGQFDSELIRHFGRKVYLRVDERDVSQVTVWTPDDRFICAARCNQLLPANANHELLGTAIAEKKRHRKLVREYHQQRPRLAEELPDLMLRAAAARQAKPISGEPPEPPPIRPVRSHLESELPRVRRALEFQAHAVAVGAESMSARFEYDPKFTIDEED